MIDSNGHGKTFGDYRIASGACPRQVELILALNCEQWWGEERVGRYFGNDGERQECLLRLENKVATDQSAHAANLV